jgi:hypothetical protein
MKVLVDMEDLKTIRDFLDCGDTDRALEVVNSLLKEHGEKEE